jgi:hypothetical protein
MREALNFQITVAIAAGASVLDNDGLESSQPVIQ